MFQHACFIAFRRVSAFDQQEVVIWNNCLRNLAEGNESTPESMKASVVDQDEEGFPSPPLGDIAFFSAQTISIELSQFFDGMDDDGNPRNSGGFNVNHGNGRKPSLENKGEQQKKQEVVIKKKTTVAKPTKPSGGESGPGRPTKPALEQKLKKLRRSDEDVVQVKLEATKRKLQERYEEAEKAKRHRTIQVMELHDIPKKGPNQGVGLKNAHMRPGNNNRHWTNGRR
uniref:Uncharacterized protein n=1 Tax=Solanum lycopersicum TaxID=4081 RepID=A0A3Q7JBY0_SOLLC